MDDFFKDEFVSSTNSKIKDNKIIYKGKVIGVTHKGEGIVEIADVQANNKTYDVSKSFPQELVTITPYRSKRKQLKKKAMLSDVLQSPWIKIVPFCSHYHICGGCSMQEIHYAQQLEIKTEHVRSLLSPLIKKQSSIQVSETGIPKEIEKLILYGPKKYYYRNRVEYTCGAKKWLENKDMEDLSFAMDKEGNNRKGLGFHVKGFYDRVAHLTHCYLHESNKIRDAIYFWSQDNDIVYFDSRTHQGWLRSITVRNNLEGQYMVIASMTFENRILIESLINILREKFSSIVSIYSAINTTSNDTLQNVDLTLEYGTDHIMERCGHVQLKIMPQVFYQTNSYLAPDLYQSIKIMAEFSGDERLLDLYCGIGSIGLYMSDVVKFVVGIEIMEKSIELAQENAHINNISNIEFYVGSVEEVLYDNASIINNCFDVVIVDPPRAGLHSKVIHYLLDVHIPKIVYVSCNPITLTRDLEMLQSHYDIIQWQAVDMFPHTYHIETIVYLKTRDMNI